MDRIIWDAHPRELAIIYTRRAAGRSKRVVDAFRFGSEGLVVATEVLHGHLPG